MNFRKEVRKIMKIAIFENDQFDLKKLKECINVVMENFSIPYELIEIKNKIELLEKIHGIDLLFLDIELENDNGITIGKKIRECNKDCKIVIVSKFQKYLIEGYKIKAERYFIKPIDIQEFKIEMKNILNEFYVQDHGFIDEKIIDKKIFIKNIIMVEFFDRHTILHCVNNEKYQTPYPLKYWLDKLKLYGFSQCYKSYIVNCQYVDYINKIDVILFNGKKIPISRHFRDSFRKDFFNNIGNRI